MTTALSEHFVGSLMPHQAIAAQYLLARDRAILALAPGLGKTATTLSVLDLPADVICPAGVVNVWHSEIEKFRPDLRGKVAIHSWDAVPETCEGTLVLDEVHYAKNPWTAARARKAMALSRAARRCWGLSGTVMPNTVQDIWGILNVLGVADKIGAEAFRANLDLDGDTIGTKSSLRELLDPYILRQTKDVMGLPEKTRSPHRVVLVPDPPDTVGRQEIESHKVDWLIENLILFRSPMVVFTCYKAGAARLAELPGWSKIDGTVTAARRTAIIRDFQAGKIDKLAITKAAAEGITLTRGHTLIRTTLDWTPATNLQVEDRIHRIGLDHEVEIVDLVADHHTDARAHGVVGEKWANIKRLGY